MKLMAGNSNLPLARAIAGYLEIPLTDASVRRFADEEVFVEIHENVRGEDVFVLQSTSFPANDNLMELLICIDALKRASARRITAVVPYFGYARQDRKPGPRTPISAKLVANLITQAGADRVLAVDLHDYRLELARKMGASDVFNPGREGTAGDIADWLVQTNEGYGVDIVLEMSGAATAINAAFKGVGQGGRVTLFGIPSRSVTIEDLSGDLIFKNLTVLAVSGRRIFETWYKTRWLLESGIVDLRPIITHEKGVEEIDEAIGRLDDALKQI